jgi:hypothetical protein
LHEVQVQAGGSLAVPLPVEAVQEQLARDLAERRAKVYRELAK